MSKSKILFFLSGSIAAFKACQVISRLVQDGHEVQAVATQSALKFIGSATLEGLTGKPLLMDLWQQDRAMDHIHLSRWADFGVLCPASANTIARLAHGLADDLVSAMILAWPKSKALHVFPAMNHEMLNSALTQDNLMKLAAVGMTVHPTQSGSLACGEEGAGRLLEAEDILLRIQPKPLGSILITSGATREPIDGIRFISNVSTGQTGASLADHLMSMGWNVTYVHGVGAAKPKAKCQLVPYSNFSSLNEVLREHLGRNKFSAAIHCAAVSDYSVGAVNNQSPDQQIKMSSGNELTINLKSNFKILPRLKEYSSSKDIKIIGFKLTLNAEAGETLEKALGLLSPAVDAVVANDWSTVDKDRRRHPGQVVRPQHTQTFFNLPSLAKLLHELIFNPEVSHGSLS